MAATTDNQPPSTQSQTPDSAGKVPDFMVFKDAQDHIKKLVSMMDDQEKTLKNNRELRYADIDIESERKSNRIAPDEIYVPQHLIDTNIRREQAIYVSYVTQAPRTVILSNIDQPTLPSGVLERDFTNKTRYEGWQFPIYRTIDGMQQNGYAIVELIADQTKPGHLALQNVGFGDFGYSLDSKNIQDCEMVVRRYYFTKTKLLALTNSQTFAFSKEQVSKVVTYKDSEAADYKEQSLFKVEKVMFRKDGVVQVAWTRSDLCDDWIRKPRPLSLGRKEQNPITGVWEDATEVNYPFYLIPYLICENTTVKYYRGRAYLDQDFQEAISSLMSSCVTAHRRASYLMFGNDGEFDPNADVVEQANIVCKSGAIIKAKVKQFSLNPPDPSMLSAIQALANVNAQENSQINYAAMNRQDSRKTAREIDAVTQSSQQLSTVQISLFSFALKTIYSDFFAIVRSRVLSGAIKVSQELMTLYSFNYDIRPAGDIDVVERQQKVQAMMTAWPVISATPAAQIFLKKLLELQFPEDAAQYNELFQQDNTKNQVLGAALHVLQALVADPSALSPQEQQNVPQLQQLIQQITQVLQPQQQTKTQNATQPVRQNQPMARQATA